MELLYFLLSFLLFVIGLKFYQSSICCKNLPPSPLALPIIGHFHLLKQPFHRTLHQLSQKYGPIFFLRFASRPVVIVSSSSIAEECFTKNDIILANRPKFPTAKYLTYNYNNLFQASYGDLWRNLRRISTIEIFSNHRLNKLQSIRKEEIKRLVVTLSNSSPQDFSRVELKSTFHELMFNIMIRMIGGKRYYGGDVSDEEEARQFRKLMREAAAYGGVANLRDFFPILNWVDGGAYMRAVIIFAKKFDKFFQGLIDERRSKENLESMNTMIDHLLSLQESEPEYYTDEIIKGLIQVVLFAGTGSSAVTLEWAMSNLLNHPSILKKAKDEMDNQIGQECLLDETDVPKLPYLQNIISETLRLHPAAPLLAPHLSSEDCTLGGYTVPRDTMLLVNVWAMQRDPTLWEEPLSFKPERFENGEAESFKLLPFGLGRRSCPGAGLAHRVISLTLGSLVQCFEWNRVSEKEVDMKEGQGFVIPKDEPLEALCRARPIMKKILS